MIWHTMGIEVRSQSSSLTFATIRPQTNKFPATKRMKSAGFYHVIKILLFDNQWNSIEDLVTWIYIFCISLLDLFHNFRTCFRDDSVYNLSCAKHLQIKNEIPFYDRKGLFNGGRVLTETESFEVKLKN